tara:strand:+ start:215 stop:382 length:168 start_codon:yes stop_codon:yes gene_type:complete
MLIKVMERLFLGYHHLLVWEVDSLVVAVVVVVQVLVLFLVLLHRKQVQELEEVQH